MCFRQHLRNKNKEDLVESTDVVPAKYPPKVKLENLFHNSRQGQSYLMTLRGNGPPWNL